ALIGIERVVHVVHGLGDGGARGGDHQRELLLVRGDGRVVELAALDAVGERGQDGVHRLAVGREIGRDVALDLRHAGALLGAEVEALDASEHAVAGRVLRAGGGLDLLDGGGSGVSRGRGAATGGGAHGGDRDGGDQGETREDV